MTKHRHHGIADRLNQRAVFICDRLLQDIKVIHDATKCRCVANLAIHSCRVFQIREQDRQCADGNLLAGSQRFTRKQIAEDLQSCHLGGRRGIIAPCGAFQNE